MKRSLIILVALLAPSSTFAGSPDLCAEEVLLNELNEPYVDSQGTTLSRDCVWTGPGAPIWAGDICCDTDAAGTTCEVPSPDTNECLLGAERYYCEHGEPIASGGFVCYQEFDGACELGFCSEGDPPPSIQAPRGSTEATMCCFGGTCWDWEGWPGFLCEGVFTWCDDGYLMIDGTVECFD